MTTAKQSRANVTVRTSVAGLAALDAEAELDSRSRSDMGRILWAEAIAARRKKRGTNPA